MTIPITKASEILRNIIVGIVGSNPIALRIRTYIVGLQDCSRSTNLLLLDPMAPGQSWRVKP